MVLDYLTFRFKFWDGFRQFSALSYPFEYGASSLYWWAVPSFFNKVENVKYIRCQWNKVWTEEYKIIVYISKLNLPIITHQLNFKSFTKKLLTTEKLYKDCIINQEKKN